MDGIGSSRAAERGCLPPTQGPALPILPVVSLAPSGRFAASNAENDSTSAHPAIGGRNTAANRAVGKPGECRCAKRVVGTDKASRPALTIVTGNENTGG